MKRWIVIWAALAVAWNAAAQGGIRVEVHDVVGVSERFNVVFVIDGEHDPTDFSWTPTEDFQLVWGPQKGSSRSTQIINGKVSKSARTTYTYILLPKSTGSFRLPPATAKMKGESISSKSFTVEVVQDEGGRSASRNGGSSGTEEKSGDSNQGRQDTARDGDMFMRFSLSRTDVVIGEPITATLKLYQRANIVGFENARFPVFNGFWSKETDAPSNIEFRREAIGDMIYDAALLRRWVLIPQKSGTLTIDPAEIVCLYNVQTRRSGSGSIFEDFFDNGYETVRKRLTTAPATVRVSPLPSGAPASYGGGVGTYSVSASLSKDSLKTHEAASLIVTVSGKGNISLLEAPKINFPPDFDVYDVKTSLNTDKSGTSGSKTFEYPFIPRSHGNFVLDPIRYGYFDVQSKRYATASTDSLRIRVAKGEAGTVSEPQTQGLTVDRKGVKNLGEDIRFIKTKNRGFSSGDRFLAGRTLYPVLLAVLAGLAAALWLAFRKAAALRADVVGTRNRKATKMALKRLKLSGEFLSKNLQGAFYEELHRALLGFVSDKLAIDRTDQNKETISASLQEKGISSALAEEFTDLLDACEYARYAPDSDHDAMSTHYKKAVELITAIDSNMKKTSSGKGPAALLALLLLVAPSLLHAQSYPDSLWRAGAEAYTAGDWASAEEAWTGISDAGLVSAELYYNLGNACFKTGETARAILFYERALKLDPSDPDIRYNLEYARSMTQDRIDSVPEFFLKGWIRKIGYWMSSDAWAILSILFFAGMLAMALLFLLGRTSGARRTGFFTAIALLLLFLSAFGFARSQYREARRSDSAIVMRAVSPVKSSPSADTAKDLFILHEGTKVRLLDSVGGWDNIELADGRQGWIRHSDLEII